MESLAEALLKVPQGGAVAVWSSSVLTEPSVHPKTINDRDDTVKAAKHTRNITFFLQRSQRRDQRRQAGLVLFILIFVALVSFTGLFSLREAQAQGSFQYRKSITINSGQVSSGPQTNFPFLFSTTDPNLKTVANGGHVESSSGYDIIFRGTDDTTCGGAGTSPCTLDHEIEKYVGTTGELVAWVRVPSINSGTVIYIYYGDSSITSSTENKNGVWDVSYKGVWHLGESGSPYNDSTSNANNSIAGIYPTQTSGILGNGESFNGSSNYINFGSNITISGSITVSQWVNPNNNTWEYIRILQRANGDGNGFSMRNAYAARRFWWQAKRYSNSAVAQIDADYTMGTWYYLAGIYDSWENTLSLYLNGVKQTSTTSDVASDGGGNVLEFGKRANQNMQWFNGIMDEVRISATVRSPGWIATEYNNQSAPSSFYTVGPEASGVVYYSKGSLAVDTASNWNTARDGSGTDASSFGTQKTWVIQNGHSMTLSGSATWDVSSSGTVQIESGGILTNTSSGEVTIGTFENDGGGAYSHGTSNSLPGTTKVFQATSTVNYSLAGGQTVEALTYGHLTLSNSGTKTFPSGTTGIAGNLTVSGSASANATTNSSTIDYNGSSSQSVGAISYYNLTLSNSGTKTFPSGTTGIAGNLTVSGSASANTTTNSSTIDYNGSSSQSVGAISYYNLTLSNSGTKTLAGNASVAGDLTVSAGTFNLSTYTANRATTGGTITVLNGATLQIGGTNSFPSNYPTHTLGATSTVNYSGTTQTVSAETYGHLTISGSGTKTLGGASSVAGDLTVSGGTFSLGSYTANRSSSGGTITLSNGATFSIGGTNSFPTNYATHTLGATSTVNYSGTTQTVNAETYGHLTISGSGTKTLGGASSVAGDLTVSAGTFNLSTYTANRATTGGTITVLNGATLRIEGTNSFPSNYSTRTLGAISTVNYSGTTQTVSAETYGHLTISGSGNKTFASGTTGIAGSFTISAGTVDATTNTTTINYNGSGTQTINAISYYHLTLSNAGTKTFASGTTNIAGDLTVSGSASGNGTTNITTINFNGSGTQAVAAISYYHLTLSNGGTKTIATGTTAAGNLTTSGTVTASCSGSLTVTGNVTIGSGTIFTGGSGMIDINGSLTAGGASFTSTSGNLYVAGDFSVTAGTFTHNSGTIVLDGTNTTISAAGATLNNLAVSRVAINNYLSLGASLTVQGTVSVTNGYLVQDPSYNLTAGAITIEANGILRNYGTGTLTLGGNLSNSGTVDFNGGGDGNCGSATEAQIRSTVDGTQRSWSGSGTFKLVDVDVKDQGGTANITVYHGTDSGGNDNTHWTFNSGCTGAPTAVTFISFTGTEHENGLVLLQWRTGYEVDNLGFHVYREQEGSFTG